MPLIHISPYKKLTGAVLQILATWNPADKGTVTLSNNNRTAVSANGSGVRSTVSKSTGKWYWEYRIDTFGGNSAFAFGIADASVALVYHWQSPVSAKRVTFSPFNQQDSHMFNGVSDSILPGVRGKAGDIIGVAVDFDNLKIQFFLNNVSVGPGQFTIPAGNYFAFTSDGGSGSALQSTVNFGQSAFSYTPPTGYNAGLYGEDNPAFRVYATLNPSDMNDATLSEGNLYYQAQSTTGKAARATVGVSSGKWYWEYDLLEFNAGTCVGIQAPNGQLASFWASSANQYLWYTRFGGAGTTQGQLIKADNAREGYAYCVPGDTVGVMLDLDNLVLEFTRNGIKQGPIAIAAGTYKPFISDPADNYLNKARCRFGATAFKYTVPEGYHPGVY